MKKFTLLTAILLICFSMFAQERRSCPQGKNQKMGKNRDISKVRATQSWSNLNGNFVATDIKGVQHDLQSYLDAGKFVFIDVSTTWCGYCWDFHQSHILKTLHNTYGPAGTDELVVLFVEADPTTDMTHLNGTASQYTLGDWTDGGTVPYPIIDDASIENVIEVGGYPTTVMICPGGYYKDVWGDIYENLSPQFAEQQATKIKNMYANCPADAAPDFSIFSTSMALKNTPVSISLGFDSPSTSTVSYAWTFQGGTPATSTTQTTSVVWPEAGSYEITLVATNNHGTTTKTKNINIVNELISFTYDFEACADFVLDEFDPATTYDGDGRPTYSFQGIAFPVSEYIGSYVAFNPSTTTPPMTSGEIIPHGGQKFGACFSAVPDNASVNANDDWFITPRINLGINSHFSFWAKSYVTTYGPELFNVLVSTSNNEVASFTNISGGSPIETPAVWTKYEYDLSAYDNTPVYVAIQCVSSDTFVFMIDDIELISLPSSSLSVSPQNVIFAPNGGEKTLNVNANLAWTVAPHVGDWLTVTPTSGTNNGTINIVAAAFEGEEDRTVTLIVSGENNVTPVEVTITQSATPIDYALDVTPVSLVFEGEGGDKPLEITSNINWTISKEADWLSLSLESGSDDGSVIVTATANNGTENRTASITISGDNGVESKVVEVSQAFIVPELNVSPESLVFEATGGNKTLQITSNVDWTITKDADWLSISSEEGSNDLSITVTATANNGTENRTANITIAGSNGVESKIVQVSQDFVVVVPELKVSPESLTFQATGGNKTLQVTSNIDWTVNKDADWLTLSAASGSDNASITVSAAAFTGETARTAIVKFAGENVESVIVNVSQSPAGTSYSLEVNPASLNFVAEGGQETFEITSNVNWTITKDADWLTLSVESGSQNASVNVSASENAETEDRTATITVTGDNNVEVKKISVSQLKTSSIESDEFSQLQIYPNPANDVLNISNAEGTNIVITNSIGQVVKEIKSISNNEQIDISAFDSGTYFVKLIIGSSMSNRRFVILK